MGVGGCRCSSSTRTSHITFASCALRKSAPSSASAADAATSLRMVQVIWIAIHEYRLSVSRNANQEEVTACTTSCLGCNEVEGIRVYVEDMSEALYLIFASGCIHI
jgi:hypothetical protein